MLLETWLEIESAHDPQFALTVKAKLPIKVKKRRQTAVPTHAETATQAGNEAGGEVLLNEQDAEMAGWEEYYDYVFPEDEQSGKSKSARNLKLLEMARRWKKEEGEAAR